MKENASEVYKGSVAKELIIITAATKMTSRTGNGYNGSLYGRLRDGSLMRSVITEDDVSA